MGVNEAARLVVALSDLFTNYLDPIGPTSFGLSGGLHQIEVPYVVQ